ncbi:NRDE family protein [Urechidicola vernalis]|uniref:NRDE family protein n=1 Tax=Urechidicola vernalis TaxID=3075600 RepID=A0ABU2Y8K3_9FLAO|nr:NRDE family protein [Urechidicola sp. P050]MDT0554072.1 NRDE family protein [Urechidicola sp. P050]
MCTVTFLPLSDTNFILTSSRDVPFAREKASAPKEYIEDGVKITYPKDGDAGGSWIGSSEKKRLICLLNGGYKDHVIQDSYRASRGLIVKELLKASDTKNALSTIDLTNIEPFTLVVIDWNDGIELLDFVWTGEKRHLFSIPKTPHIWSSSTLYDDATKKLREDWFEDWQNKQAGFKQSDILKFHKTAGIGNPETDVLMKRKGGGTVSITTVSLANDKAVFDYEAID